MWEEGVRIYGTPGVHNNFPDNKIFFQLNYLKFIYLDLLYIEVKNLRLLISIMTIYIYIYIYIIAEIIYCNIDA